MDDKRTNSWALVISQLILVIGVSVVMATTCSMSSSLERIAESIERDELVQRSRQKRDER